MTTVTDPGSAALAAGPGRAVSRFFRRHRRFSLFATLTPPVAWMVLIYIGSLLLLVVSALFKLNPLSQKPTTTLTGENLKSALTDADLRTVLIRTVLVAAGVTVLCLVLALPTAYFIAKVVPQRFRRLLVVSILLPLWAGYLVKGYAWRAVLSEGGNKVAAEGAGGGGFLKSVLGFTPGYSMTGVVLALTYLWLPYMVLPIYSGIERLPVSLLDASSDLGAKSLRTFTSVIMPLLLPSIAAGSIFTFSLSLGDYIIPKIVSDGDVILIGNYISTALGAPNQPLAAAYTLWPLLIIVVYLVAMKRAGAFENV